MGKISLQELFGSNARESSDAIAIAKADLTGLAPLAENPAASIWAAIVQRACSAYQGEITDGQGEIIIDEVGSALFYDQSALYAASSMNFWASQIAMRGTDAYRRYSWLAEFSVTPAPDIGVALNPNSIA